MNTILSRTYLVIICLIIFMAAGCSDQGSNTASTTKPPSTNIAPPPASSTSPGQQTGGSLAPASNLTVADVAKIKWLEGSYRGTYNQKPFFNRYRFNGTTLNVSRFEDEAMTKETQSAVYELKDGMFANPSGEQRFAATKMTEDLIQFVSVTSGPSISYKLERQTDGSVHATLEAPGPDGRPQQTEYDLERLKK